MAKKNYFNNDMVEDMLIEYQSIVETTFDEETKRTYVINKSPRVEYLENEITKQIMLIVKAIIYVYRYDRFMEYDELFAQGLKACWENYLKFKKEDETGRKFSAFNYFSLIVKRCLFGLTTRETEKNKKKVYVDDLGDALHSMSFPNIDGFVDDLSDELHDIVDCNFLSKKRRKYLFISDVICDYIRKTKAYISKTDMYRFCGCYSLRAIDIRQYMNDMKPFLSEMYGIIEFDDENTLYNNNVEENDDEQ